MDTKKKSEIVFKEFLELVHRLNSDDKEVHRALQKSYSRTNPHFRWSRGFINLVTLCSDKIRAAPEKRLLHIREFISELSNYKAKPLKHLLGNASQISDSDDSSVEDAPPPPKKPNIVIVKASELNEVTSSPKQKKSHPNGSKGSDVQTAVSNGSTENRGEKRKSFDDTEENSKAPVGTGESNSENQKKKRWFYNAASAKKSAESSLSMIGYVKNVCKSSQLEIENVDSKDIICLDDDEDETCGGSQTDDDTVEGDDKTTASSKSDLKRTCLNNTKTRTKFCPKNSSSATDKTPPNEIEVICLDDDDDDIQESNKCDSQTDSSKLAESLRKHSYPVQKLIEKSSLLPVKSIADLGIIEIIDTEEKQSEEKKQQSKNICSKTQEEGGSIKFIDRLVEPPADAVASESAVETGEDGVGHSTSGPGDGAHGSKGENDVTCEFDNDGNRDEGGVSSDAADDEAEDEEISKQVVHLNRVLKKLSKKIQRLEVAEMSLEDLNSEESTFIKASELKYKFVETWKQLCDIVDADFTSPTSNKKIAMEIPDYPEIGRKISEFISQDEVFPDFQDICEIVVSCNNSCNLLLTENAVEDLCKHVFTSVGSKIQQRRKTDLFNRMQSYLPENLRSYDDPAVFDSELCKKLEENGRLGNENLESVFTAFSEKQTIDSGEAADEYDKDDENEDDEDHSSDDNDNEDNDDDVVKPVDEAQEPQDGSCLERSVEIARRSSSAEQPASDTELLSADVESLKGDAETIDDSLSEDDPYDGEEESVKESCSEDDDDDVLVIRFVANDDQSANESDVSSEKQDKKDSTGNDTGTPGNSELKIRSDRLDSIRRLTSNLTFLSNGGNATTPDANDRLEHASTANISPKILEVEIVDNHEAPIGDLSPDQTVDQKQCDSDVNNDTIQEEDSIQCSDTVEAIGDKVMGDGNSGDVDKVEQSTCETACTSKSVPIDDNPPDADKDVADVLSEVVESVIVSDSISVSNKTEAPTDSGNDKQVEPESHDKLDACSSVPASGNSIVISPEISIVQARTASELPTALPCSSDGDGISLGEESSTANLAENQVHSADGFNCNTGLPSPTSILDSVVPLCDDVSLDVVDDVQVDSCSASDLELLLESSSENLESSLVSIDPSTLNVGNDDVDNIYLSSDMELTLKSSAENAEAFADTGCLSSDKCAESSDDAVTNEQFSLLLEKLREACAKDQLSLASSSKQKTVASPVVTDDAGCDARHHLATKDLPLENSEKNS